MVLTVSRKRAEEFDDALTAGRADGRTGGLVPEQVDGHARELALVAQLREVGAAADGAPSDEFRTALRSRLLAVATVQGIGESTTAPAPARARGAASWRQRATVVAAGALASVVAVTGVSVAASRSLPGDPFYGLKRVAEDIQLRFADGSAEEGARYLELARTRMSELRKLALGRDLSGRDDALTSGDAGRVNDVLDDMDEATRNAVLLLTDAFRTTQEPAPLEQLARFADSQEAGLREVLPELPAGSRSRAEASLALIAGVGTSAEDMLLLRDCTAVCDPSATAPGLPGGDGSCFCPTPPPAPSVAPAPSTAPEPAPDGQTTPPPTGSTPAPAPEPTSPSSPAPGSTLPVPLPSNPLPSVPVPSNPLPTLPGVDPGVPVIPLDPGGVLSDPGGALSGITGASLSISPSTGLTSVVVLALRSWWGAR